MSVSWKPLKRSLWDHRAWARSLVVLALVAAATGTTTTDSQSTEVSHVGSYLAFRDYLSMPAHIILITVHLILNSTAYLSRHSPYNSHGTISDHCKFSPDLLQLLWFQSFSLNLTGELFHSSYDPHWFFFFTNGKLFS